MDILQLNSCNTSQITHCEHNPSNSNSKSNSNNPLQQPTGSDVAKHSSYISKKNF